SFSNENCSSCTSSSISFCRSGLKLFSHLSSKKGITSVPKDMILSLTWLFTSLSVSSKSETKAWSSFSLNLSIIGIKYCRKNRRSNRFGSLPSSNPVLYTCRASKDTSFGNFPLIREGKVRVLSHQSKQKWGTRR